MWLSSMQAAEDEWIEVQSNYIIVINLKYNVIIKALASII